MWDSAIAPAAKVVVFGRPTTNLAPWLAAIAPPLPQPEITHLEGSAIARLLSPSGDAPVNWLNAIDGLRQERFTAALILTNPGASPYTLGYLCYLAGIPIRVGRSQEFGGQVLTHCLPVEKEQESVRA